MTRLTTLSQIHKLQDRYPFSEEELEILVRCHDHLRAENDEDDFLAKLAFSSPYAYFFLPGDEMKDRVTWLEDHILPMGFPNQLRAAISADPFVAYASEGEDKSLERFIEGIADTGRRGPREALNILYELIGDEPRAEELLDTCFRLAVASDAMIVPNLDKEACLKRVADVETLVKPMVKSLEVACGKEGSIKKKAFIDWAEKTLPLLSAPFSTFMHHLIFRGSPYPIARVAYSHPMLDNASEIFTGADDSPLLYSLSLISRYFTGKLHRLYSSELDGRSFNRLEWAMLGYEGPTMLVVKTDEDAIIGAFAHEPWKEALDFHGSTECFLFQLEPELKIKWGSGPQDHFMYMHSGEQQSPLMPQLHGLPHGIGFGGNTTSKPRLFIPETLEHCTAGFMDKTYEPGNLLPDDSLEKFEIKRLEVWGVGEKDTIAEAMQKRAEHRVHYQESLDRARIVKDKTQFVKDLSTGFTPSKLYQHREDARGRAEFRVDEAHGGYKLDRDD